VKALRGQRPLDRVATISYKPRPSPAPASAGRASGTPPKAQVAQLVEQRTENPRVGGSNPPLGTIFILCRFLIEQLRIARSARYQRHKQPGKTPLSALSTSRGNRARGSASTAILTKSATDLARNFRIAVARCTFTVTSLTPKSAAICLFKAPAATRATISRSRALSELKLSRKAEFASSSARRARSFSRAVATASNKSCSRNGLVRKSTAPAFIARTAIGMSPCPVRKTIGT
jgi:hypothetical protein